MLQSYDPSETEAKCAKKSGLLASLLLDPRKSWSRLSLFAFSIHTRSVVFYLTCDNRSRHAMLFFRYILFFLMHAESLFSIKRTGPMFRSCLNDWWISLRYVALHWCWIYLTMPNTLPLISYQMSLMPKIELPSSALLRVASQINYDKSSTIL